MPLASFNFFILDFLSIFIIFIFFWTCSVLVADWKSTHTVIAVSYFFCCSSSVLLTKKEKKMMPYFFICFVLFQCKLFGITFYFSWSEYFLYVNLVNWRLDRGNTLSFLGDTLPHKGSKELRWMTRYLISHLYLSSALARNWAHSSHLLREKKMLVVSLISFLFTCYWTVSLYDNNYVVVNWHCRCFFTTWLDRYKL